MRHKVISLFVSLIIICLLFMYSHPSRLFVLFRDTVPLYLGLGMLLFVPTILIPAWRWQYILSDRLKLAYFESVRLVLAGSTLNVFLPSKAGDLLKAFFVDTKAAQNSLGQETVVARAIYEKALDLIGLTVSLWIGLIFFKSWNFVVYTVAFCSLFVFVLFLIVHFNLGLNALKSERKGFWGKICGLFFDLNAYGRVLGKDLPKLFVLLLVSVVLWSIHLLQFYCFFKMFGFETSLVSVFAQMPVAIYTGLLPLTVGGIGTRDAAVVFLFQGSISYEGCLGIGLMGTFRYLVPAALGAFFVFNYVKRLGRFWKKV